MVGVEVEAEGEGLVRCRLWVRGKAEGQGLVRCGVRVIGFRFWLGVGLE